MKVKIITEGTPEELEKSINKFLEINRKAISISYAIGAYPKGAEFSALIIFDE